jgi:hypothetical protein
MEFLGTQGRGEIGGALDIHEEDGDLLPLPLERPGFFQDPLGQMLGGIGDWRPVREAPPRGSGLQ